MSATEQKRSSKSLIFSAVAVIIVIGIATISRQQVGGEPSVTVSDERVKPRTLQPRVVEDSMPTSSAPTVAAEARGAEKDDADLPEKNR